MDSTLMTIIGIFLVAILMCVFPALAVAERHEDIAQGVVQTATSEYAEAIATAGVIKPSMHEEYLEKIAATGNTYEVGIEVKKFDDNPGKKPGITSGNLNGENVYVSYYDAVDKMYEDANNPKNYPLKKGDIVIVTAKNINTTMAQSLRSFFYKITGEGTYQIAASASSMVVNTGK